VVVEVIVIGGVEVVVGEEAGEEVGVRANKMFFKNRNIERNRSWIGHYGCSWSWSIGRCNNRSWSWSRKGSWWYRSGMSRCRSS